MIHTPAVLQAGIAHFANGESIVNRRLIHQLIHRQRFFILCISMIKFLSSSFPFSNCGKSNRKSRLVPTSQTLGGYIDYPSPTIRWSTRGLAQFAATCSSARHCGCRRKKGRWKGHRLLCGKMMNNDYSMLGGTNGYITRKTSIEIKIDLSPFYGWYLKK